MSPTLKSAVIRGIRTFVAAFLAVYGAPAILGAASGSQPIDTNALRAAAVAGIAAVISLVWRAFIDPLPIPTLADKNPVPPPSS
jgi:xanthine/uracil/vitamin C permease (AzgA family)